MITLGSFKDIDSSKYDEIWLIVRSLKDQSILTRYPNVKHVPELSPSHELFSWYLSIKRRGWWDQSQFANYYVPTFIRETACSREAKDKLNELYCKAHTMHKNILVVCFCTDEEMCHRSIIGGLLQGAGVAVVSSNLQMPHYEGYYHMYMSVRHCVDN
jgi:uncharacterized protein YeaO (DUF488 family)